MKTTPLEIDWNELKGKIISVALPFPKKHLTQSGSYDLGIIDSYIGRLEDVKGETLILNPNLDDKSIYSLFVCNKNFVISLIVYNDRRTKYGNDS